MAQPGLQCLVGTGALIVFGGGTGSPPDPFLPPPPPPSPGDMPVVDRAQGFPEVVGFRAVYTGPMLREFGSMADEKTQ